MILEISSLLVLLIRRPLEVLIILLHPFLIILNLHTALFNQVMYSKVKRIYKFGNIISLMVKFKFSYKLS